MDRKKELIENFKQALILRKKFSMKVSMAQDEIFNSLMIMKKEFPDMKVGEVFQELDMDLFAGIVEEDTVRKQVKDELSEID